MTQTSDQLASARLANWQETIKAVFGGDYDDLTVKELREMLEAKGVR